MVINKTRLLEMAPIKNMLGTKEKHNGCSHGLSEAGYDIRVKQTVIFTPANPLGYLDIGTAAIKWMEGETQYGDVTPGNFTLASAIEEFDMPDNLVGIVHDKSTWARKRLSVFNTVIEPGWKGFLTLELVYHGHDKLIIPAGTGIAQVIFHELSSSASYDGKYQNAPDMPVAAIKS